MDIHNYRQHLRGGETMRSLLFYANAIIIMVIAFFSIVSIALTVNNYLKYGYSYNIVTEVDGGDVRVQIVTVWDSFNITILLIAVLVVMILDTITIERKRKNDLPKLPQSEVSEPIVV